MINEKEILYDIFNLNYKTNRIVNYEKQDSKHIFTIEWRLKTYECPMCWKRTSKRKDLRKVKTWRNWKHMYLSDKTMIELSLLRRYFRCKKCWISFMEKFDFEVEKWEHTKTYENFVIYSRWHMSWSQIAKNTQCSPWKIHDILKNINPDKINIQGMKIMEELEEINLWIDEHSFRWKDMVLVITDIKEKKVLTILDDTRVETLKQRLHNLSDKIKNKIKWLSTDMNKWYKNTVESYVPNVASGVDKYHLVQEVNKVVDDVRKLNIWLMKMGYVKADELIKHWKIKKFMLGKKKMNKKEN